MLKHKIWILWCKISNVKFKLVVHGENSKPMSCVQNINRACHRPKDVRTRKITKGSCADMNYSLAVHKPLVCVVLGDRTIVSSAQKSLVG